MRVLFIKIRKFASLQQKISEIKQKCRLNETKSNENCAAVVAAVAHRALACLRVFITLPIHCSQFRQYIECDTEKQLFILLSSFVVLYFFSLAGWPNRYRNEFLVSDERVSVWACIVPICVLSSCAWCSDFLLLLCLYGVASIVYSVIVVWVYCLLRALYVCASVC